MTKRSIQIEKTRPRTIQRVPDSQDEVIHIKPTPITTTPQPVPVRWTLALLALTISFTLFILAYAGPAIGNVLGYLVLPGLGFFPGLAVAERYGKVAGILAGALLVAVLTPAYGATLIANSISMFTSLQTISQGILVFLGLLCFLASILVLALQRLRK